jgi:hypothetical protein
MERERTIARPAAGGGGPAPEGDVVEQVRNEADGILSAADRILDSLKPLNAEDYLLQNRQRGGQ